MSEIIDAVVKSAQLQQAVTVAKSARSALQELNLPTLDAEFEYWLASFNQAQHAPLYAAKVKIFGDQIWSWYDDSPEETTTRDGCKQATIAPRSLEDAVKMALRQFEKYQAIAAEAGEVKGVFIPRTIQIFDQFGTVIAMRLKNGQWIDEVTPSQWDELKAKAAACEREAATQIGWDNFSTADNLREEAEICRATLQISQAVASGRLVL